MLLKSLVQIIEKNKEKTKNLGEHSHPTTNFPKYESINDNKGDAQNKLFEGDNLDLLHYLLKNNLQADLIYIDPPYNSKANYFSKIQAIDRQANKPVVLETIAYTDVWKEGTVEYLDALCERLFLMHRALKQTGSMYVHLDWHIVHYVKLIMDEIFGIDNFVNEIVWQRTGAQNNAAAYGTNYDSILFYKKSNAKIWNKQLSEYTEKDLKTYFKKDDEGKYYRLNNPTGKGYQDHSRDFGFGAMFPPNGRHWSISQKEIDLLLGENKIVFTASGYPFIKKYLDEIKGKNLQAIWTDCIPPRKSPELTGYATQKPEKLLERIIKTSTNEGDLVVDFYAGSGTTGVVAEKLNRNWILAESEKSALHILKKRLIALNSSFELYRHESIKNISEVVLQRDNKLILSNSFYNLSLAIKQRDNKLELQPLAITYLDYGIFQMSKNDLAKLKNLLLVTADATIDLIEIDTNYNHKVFKPNISVFAAKQSKIEVIVELKRVIALKITDIFGLTVFHNWVIE